MKIGELVQRHITAIFNHCETQDRAEFVRLQEPRYCKDSFDINYPFCMPVHRISAGDDRRYWRSEYQVHDVPVRVTNHWFNPPTSNSLPLFLRYMHDRGIAIVEDG